MREIYKLLDEAGREAFLAGMEAAARIADEKANDEFTDDWGGNNDRGLGAANAADTIKHDIRMLRLGV